VESEWLDRSTYFMGKGFFVHCPDAYRDDLSSDGRYKSFAIGSADATSLNYNTAYFAWYLTNEGESLRVLLRRGDEVDRQLPDREPLPQVRAKLVR
jgi:hypothetical protein